MSENLSHESYYSGIDITVELGGILLTGAGALCFLCGGIRKLDTMVSSTPTFHNQMQVHINNVVNVFPRFMENSVAFAMRPVPMIVIGATILLGVLINRRRQVASLVRDIKSSEF